MVAPYTFVAESNRIEGIHRPPTPEEINEYNRFLELKKITVNELKKFVKIYQPNAVLRDKSGLNVHIIGPGGKIIYSPPKGGVNIRMRLEGILNDIGKESPCETHMRYESLHPFTDGNGRSGRMLWMWCMGGEESLSFLHRWYYQSLQNYRERKST